MSNPTVGRKWGIFRDKKGDGNKEADGRGSGGDSETTALLGGGSPPPPTYTENRVLSPSSFKVSSRDLSNMASMAKSLFDIKGDLKEQVGRAETDFNVKHMEFGAILRDECRRVEEFYVKKVR
jgi:hypothetical protein